jgi:hypothetical protein
VSSEEIHPEKVFVNVWYARGAHKRLSKELGSPGNNHEERNVSKDRRMTEPQQRTSDGQRRNS